MPLLAARTLMTGRKGGLTGGGLEKASKKGRKGWVVVSVGKEGLVVVDVVVGVEDTKGRGVVKAVVNEGRGVDWAKTLLVWKVLWVGEVLGGLEVTAVTGEEGLGVEEGKTCLGLKVITSDDRTASRGFPTIWVTWPGLKTLTLSLVKTCGLALIWELSTGTTLLGTIGTNLWGEKGLVALLTVLTFVTWLLVKEGLVRETKALLLGLLREFEEVTGTELARGGERGGLLLFWLLLLFRTAAAEGGVGGGGGWVARLLLLLRRNGFLGLNTFTLWIGVCCLKVSVAEVTGSTASPRSALSEDRGGTKGYGWRRVGILPPTPTLTSLLSKSLVL